MGKAAYRITSSGKSRIRNFRHENTAFNRSKAIFCKMYTTTYGFAYNFDGGVIDDLSEYNTQAEGYNVIFETFEDETCAVFNGSTSYIRSAEVVPDATSYSIEAKFYLDSLEMPYGRMCLFCDDDGTPYRDFYLWVYADGSVRQITKDNIYLESAAGLVEAGKWYTIKIFSSPTSTKIYLNGMEIATRESGAGNISYHSRFVIGCRFDNVNSWWDWFKGKISYISYFASRSSEQIDWGRVIS